MGFCCDSCMDRFTEIRDEEAAFDEEDDKSGCCCCCCRCCKCLAVLLLLGLLGAFATICYTYRENIMLAFKK